MCSSSSRCRMCRKFFSSGVEKACHCEEEEQMRRRGQKGQLRAERSSRILSPPTLTSPVSFSFRTKLRTFSLGPAFSRRRRGRSRSDSFLMYTEEDTAAVKPDENHSIQRCQEAAIPWSWRSLRSNRANLAGLSTTVNFFSRASMTSRADVRELMCRCLDASFGR